VICAAPRFSTRPVIDGGVVNVNKHDVGPVPVRGVRRGCEFKLVKPESVPHRRHIEGEGMVTVYELGLSFAKRLVVHLSPKRLGRTDTDAVYETFPFGIPRRPIACTVDDGDLIESCRAEDPPE